jgi:hypothetical protein
MPYQAPTAAFEDSSIISSKIPTDAVGESEIISGGVRTDEIQNSAVITAKINNSAVTTDKIADLDVTTAKINNDAVTNDKIAANAVQTDQIQNGVVTLAKCAASLTNALVPVKGIIMYSGATAGIPSNWSLCNGTNGTPDLRNDFVMPSGDLYTAGNTGGSKDAIVVSHTHTLDTITAASDHSHGIEGGTTKSLAGDAAGPDDYAGGGGQTGGGGTHTHTVTLDDTGVSGTNANLPPYFALAYIMRVS